MVWQCPATSLLVTRFLQWAMTHQWRLCMSYSRARQPPFLAETHFRAQFDGGLRPLAQLKASASGRQHANVNKKTAL